MTSSEGDGSIRVFRVVFPPTRTGNVSIFQNATDAVSIEMEIRVIPIILPVFDGSLLLAAALFTGILRVINVGWTIKVKVIDSH